jgi:hypothetical protein
MIANLTVRAFVEGSRLPSVTWEQSGSSAEKINQYWKGERDEANLGSYCVLCGSHIARSGPDGRQARKNEGRKADAEQILLQMERDGNEATVKKDVATLSELLADDWIGQSPAPQTAQLIPKQLRLHAKVL